MNSNENDQKDLKTETHTPPGANASRLPPLDQPNLHLVPSPSHSPPLKPHILLQKNIPITEISGQSSNHEQSLEDQTSSPLIPPSATNHTNPQYSTSLPYLPSNDTSRGALLSDVTPPSQSRNISLHSSGSKLIWSNNSQKQLLGPSSPSSPNPMDASQNFTTSSSSSKVIAFTSASNQIGMKKTTLTESCFLESSKPIPVDEFGIGPEELNFLVNFDKRSYPELLILLQSPKYGGVEGIAALLRTSLFTGIAITRTGVVSGIVKESATALLGLKKREKRDQEREVFYRKKGFLGHRGVRNRVFMKTLDPTETLLHVKSITSLSQQDILANNAERREDVFGSNLIPPEKPTSIISIIWSTILDDPILKILIVGAVVTLSIGTATHPSNGWTDGLAILIAVLIVLTVTAGNDYSKEKKFKKLMVMQSEKKVRVIRGGKKDTISSWDLLVGDLIEINMGDEVPADGVFVCGARLVVDESPLTGESMPIRKGTDRPFLFSGSFVSEGSAQMLITAVGLRSAAGQIQQLLSQNQNEETVLQSKLRVVAMLVGKIGFTAGFCTFFGLLIRWGISFSMQKMVWSNDQLIQILQFFVTGVTIIVVAVPEGLPLAVTISLAFSMFKMIKENCFVRHLAAAETMGQATCICTDKTGTLTENRMAVVKVCIDEKTFCGIGSSDPSAIPFNEKTFHPKMKELLGESISVNSNCFLKYKPREINPTFVGSPTEGSLLHFLEKLGSSYDTIRATAVKVPDGEFSFNSELKRMSTLIENGIRIGQTNVESLYRVLVKGASEIILSRCHYIISKECDTIRPLGEREREALLNEVKRMSSEGLRTLVIAIKDLNDIPMKESKLVKRIGSQPSLMKVGSVYGSMELESTIDREALETNLIFIALFGIKDPVRREVPLAVRQCQDAGLQVKMVTGDNLLTACKIARECGILKEKGIAMEGPEFRKLTDFERKRIVPNLQVLARSSPSDKFLVVSTLKLLGEVVAVTGDGTNDAPALKEADIGFAMGVSGTQIAMNASDIILLDDNFVTLVVAIRWGRNVLDSVRKFLQFQLSVNITAITLVLVGSVVLGDSPLTPVQLLWVNLIMDTLGALALASGNPDKDILSRPSHSRDEPILTREMREYVLVQTLYQIVTLMSLLFVMTVPLLELATTENTLDLDMSLLNDSDIELIHTMVFTSFVFLQLSNEIMARQLRHQYTLFSKFFSNRIFVINLSVILLVQVLAVVYGQDFIGTVDLSGYQWGICIGIAVGNFPYMLFMRWLLKRAGTRGKRRVGHSYTINNMESDNSIDLDV